MGLSQDAERIRNSCILCGRCTDRCPSARHGGVDPMEVMAGGEGDLDMCILCGTCSAVCRRSDPFTVIRDLIYEAQGLEVSEVYRETGFIRAPAERELEPEWEEGDVHVMLGCTVNGAVPYVEHAASVAMKTMGVRASRLPNESCCLHPIQFMAVPEHERRGRMAELGSSEKELVTLCAACAEEIGKVCDGVSHIIPFMHRHLDDLPAFGRRMKVGMEPGCSAAGFEKEMRAVLERMNCEVVNWSTGCCGKNSPVAPALLAEREAECAGAEVIVVGCPMCLVKLDAVEGGAPVVHIAELAAMAAGRGESLRYHRIPVGSGPRSPRPPGGTSP